MKLTDIASEETWVELEEEINKRSGLDANVFNVEGYRISECKIGPTSYVRPLRPPTKGRALFVPRPT